MYVTDDFVYLQLQKTACTHIAQLLATHGTGGQIGKHNALSPQLLASRRKIIGSVRNPWDWYVSLWAFGCGRKGGLHERVTRRIDAEARYSPSQWLRAAGGLFDRHTREWREVYADPNDSALFQRWLELMFDPRRAAELGEGYATSSLSRFAGFLVYRYLRLFSRDPARLFDGSLTGHDALARYAESSNVLNFVIRYENLEPDLLETLAALGRPASDEQVQLIRSAPRTNPSVRRRDFSTYYDAKSADLVADRERVIITKYGYVHPLREIPRHQPPPRDEMEAYAVE